MGDEKKNKIFRDCKERVYAADMLMYLHITYAVSKLLNTSKAKGKLKVAIFFADVLQRHNLPLKFLADLSLL